MANWISSVAGFRIDNAAGTLTDIKQYINSIRDTGGANRLDDTGLGDTRERTINGLARASSGANQRRAQFDDLADFRTAGQRHVYYQDDRNQVSDRQVSHRRGLRTGRGVVDQRRAKVDVFGHFVG